MDIYQSYDKRSTLYESIIPFLTAAEHSFSINGISISLMQVAENHKALTTTLANTFFQLIE